MNSHPQNGAPSPRDGDAPNATGAHGRTNNNRTAGTKKAARNNEKKGPCTNAVFQYYDDIAAQANMQRDVLAHLVASIEGAIDNAHTKGLDTAMAAKLGDELVRYLLGGTTTTATAQAGAQAYSGAGKVAARPATTSTTRAKTTLLNKAVPEPIPTGHVTTPVPQTWATVALQGHMKSGGQAAPQAGAKKASPTKKKAERVDNRIFFRFAPDQWQSMTIGGPQNIEVVFRAHGVESSLYTKLQPVKSGIALHPKDEAAAVRILAQTEILCKALGCYNIGKASKWYCYHLAGIPKTIGGVHGLPPALVDEKMHREEIFVSTNKPTAKVRQVTADERFPGTNSWLVHFNEPVPAFKLFQTCPPSTLVDKKSRLSNALSAGTSTPPVTASAVRDARAAARLLT